MRAFSLVAIVSLLPFQVPAQITNGNVQLRQGTTIEREISAASQLAEPSWVAWKVPTVDGRSQSCCWYQNNDQQWYGCGLEPREAGAAVTRPPQPTGPVPLEAGTTLLVMARVANGKVERVRTFSDDCPLDAGGRTVRLIDNVSTDASVRWLSDLITSSLTADGRSSIHNNALSAIGSTAGAAADAALIRFADASQPSQVRRQAIFWIGQARGASGFATLKGMLDRETAVEIRRTLVQAISRARVPEATTTLIAIAKNDKDPATRGEALFWLAQNAGKAAAAEITAAIQNDPDTKVQERAVQALSQLPKDEGVPLLIGIARTHKNPKVRERAMFWLGQSKDPRAAKFFEEILLK
jgi:hypothetical protein